MARRTLARCRIVLTGASSGIGQALAEQLARFQPRLILTARRAQRLETLAEKLRRSAAEVHLVPGDITSGELRRQIVRTARDELGGLDLLINNAGVGAVGPFAQADEARLRQIMEVNFFAPVELTRVCLPLLREGARPMVVNISSVLGHRAVPKKSEYCASKFALHGFSDAVRAELVEEGIDVLLVSPSTTASEFFDNVLERRDNVPERRFGAMSSASVARQAIRAMQRGRHEIILTPGGKGLVWIDRLLPAVADRLVARFG